MGTLQKGVPNIYIFFCLMIRGKYPFKHKNTPNSTPQFDDLEVNLARKITDLKEVINFS